MRPWLRVISRWRQETPQSFNVLMKEMQSLCLDVKLGQGEENNL